MTQMARHYARVIGAAIGAFDPGATCVRAITFGPRSFPPDSASARSPLESPVYEVSLVNLPFASITMPRWRSPTRNGLARGATAGSRCVCAGSIVAATLEQGEHAFVDERHGGLADLHQRHHARALQTARSPLDPARRENGGNGRRSDLPEPGSGGPGRRGIVKRRNERINWRRSLWLQGDRRVDGRQSSEERNQNEKKDSPVKS